MNNNDHNHKGQIAQDHILVHHEHLPRLKRIHHTWWFWFFLALMLCGIIYYIISVDFAFAPHHNQMEQPIENPVAVDTGEPLLMALHPKQSPL